MSGAMLAASLAGVATASPDVRHVQRSLQAAEDALTSVLLDDPNARGEAKTWLISTLARLQHVPGALRIAIFRPYEASSSNSTNKSRGRSRDRADSSQHGHLQQCAGPLTSCKAAQLQLLQLLTAAQPAAVAQLLTGDPDFMCSYFTASSSNASGWFGHFSMAGMQHFKYGAKALANYALTHRADVWDLLVWAGKHNQAPVAVAAKPHYFCELDVSRTVMNLATHCPRFWSSEDLLRTCEDGQWLNLDSGLVVQKLHRSLHDWHSRRSMRLQQLLSSFIQIANWSLLCTRLLPLLPDDQLLHVVEMLGQQQSQIQITKAVSSQASNWQQQKQQQLLPPQLQQWLDQQSEYCQRVAVDIDAACSNQQHLESAVVPADQLPCVAGFSALVVSGMQGLQLRQLLLINALTCHRSQLLTLLKQEHEIEEQLLQLVAAGEQLWQLGGLGLVDPPNGSPTDAAKAQDGMPEVQSASAAVKRASAQARVSAAAEQLLQLYSHGFLQKPKYLLMLFLSWLLWLRLLLASAAGATDGCSIAGSDTQSADTTAIAAAVLVEQALQQLGCVVHRLLVTQKQLLTDSVKSQPEQHAAQRCSQLGQQCVWGRVTSAGQQQQEQHKQQQPMQCEDPQLEGQIQPIEPFDSKRPLKRGQANTETPGSRSISHDSSGPNRSGSSSTSRRRHELDTDSEVGFGDLQGHSKGYWIRNRHKRDRPHKHSCKKRLKVEETKNKGKHKNKHGPKRHRFKSRKHKHAKSRRQDSSSDWGQDAAVQMDLDNRSELLDPADFEPMGSNHIKHSRPASGGDATAADKVLGISAKKQLRVMQGPGAAVQARLASLAVGGQLWQQPQLQVWLPVTDSVTAAAGSETARGAVAAGQQVGIVESGTAVQQHGTLQAAAIGPGTLRYIGIKGNITEVMDGVACYCLWGWLMQLYASQASAQAKPAKNSQGR